MWLRKMVRHGNSEAVVIPPVVRRALDLARGDIFMLTIDELHRIVLLKMTPGQLDKLEDLIASGNYNEYDERGNRTGKSGHHLRSNDRHAVIR